MINKVNEKIILHENQVFQLINNKEINWFLQKLLTQVQSILMAEFVGMYIGGSLTSSNFNPETSDVDCYIVTKNRLSSVITDDIEKMHIQFYSSNFKYVKKIEASYIPQLDLANFDSNGNRPYFNEGHFYIANYGINYLIELHVLREIGITILGPDIKSLVKEISSKNLRSAIKKNLHEYWKINLENLSKFQRNDFQVFAILTMCRTFYSLETSNITSKFKAGLWALEKLDKKWKNLVEQALMWKPNQEINKAEETRKFVKHIIDKSFEYED